MDFNTFIANYKALVDGVKLATLGVLILVNLILGVAVAFYTQTFNFKQLGAFMESRVLPYIIAYFGVGLYCVLDPSWSWAVTGTWVAVDVALLGAVLQNLRELGLPVPALMAGGKAAGGKRVK